MAKKVFLVFSSIILVVVLFCFTASAEAVENNVYISEYNLSFFSTNFPLQDGFNYNTWYEYRNEYESTIWTTTDEYGDAYYVGNSSSNQTWTHVVINLPYSINVDLFSVITYRLRYIPDIWKTVRCYVFQFDSSDDVLMNYIDFTFPPSSGSGQSGQTAIYNIKLTDSDITTITRIDQIMFSFERDTPMGSAPNIYLRNFFLFTGSLVPIPPAGSGDIGNIESLDLTLSGLVNANLNKNLLTFSDAFDSISTFSGCIALFTRFFNGFSYHAPIFVSFISVCSCIGLVAFILNVLPDVGSKAGRSFKDR